MWVSAMPLFVCSRCQCIDAVDSINFIQEPFLCCECRYGHWHGNFARVDATTRKIVENFVEYFQYSKYRLPVHDALKQCLSLQSSGIELSEIQKMDDNHLMERYKIVCHWNHIYLRYHLIDLNSL